MHLKDLYTDLKEISGLKKSRQNYADKVLHDLSLFPKLLDILFKTNDDCSYKAAWVLELVCHKKPQVIVPYLNSFCSNIHTITHDSAIRPVAKICSIICEAYDSKTPNPMQNALTIDHKNLLTETCFDWLISEQKVAAKVYAMESLYYLGKDSNWIHSELRLTLEQNFTRQSAAYKARTKHILKRINKKIVNRKS